MHNKPHPDCLVCKKVTSRTTTKFCSQACNNSYRTTNKIKRGGPKLKCVPRHCKVCQVRFLPQFEKVKHCSRRCMGLARRDDFITNVRPLKPLVVSDETRHKQSIVASKRSANAVFTKGIGGFRNDLGHYVRSSWEANFARYLKHTGQVYEFEPDTITLKDNKLEIRYTPDFKVNGGYFEVKGWWTERSLKIRKLIEEQRQDLRITYIDQEIYMKIQKDFGELIENWEYKRTGGNERAE